MKIARYSPCPARPGSAAAPAGVRRSVMPVLCAIMGYPGCSVVDQMIALHWSGIAIWATVPKASAIICALQPGLILIIMPSFCSNLLAVGIDRELGRTRDCTDTYQKGAGISGIHRPVVSGAVRPGASRQNGRRRLSCRHRAAALPRQ